MKAGQNTDPYLLPRKIYVLLTFGNKKTTKPEHLTVRVFFKLAPSFFNLLFQDQPFTFKPRKSCKTIKIKTNRHKHLNMGIYKVHPHLKKWQRKSLQLSYTTYLRAFCFQYSSQWLSERCCTLHLLKWKDKQPVHIPALLYHE